jgi:hypothetical protein
MACVAFWRWSPQPCGIEFEIVGQPFQADEQRSLAVRTAAHDNGGSPARGNRVDKEFVEVTIDQATEEPPCSRFA